MLVRCIFAVAIAAFMPCHPALGVDTRRWLAGEWAGTFNCDGQPRHATVIFKNEDGGRFEGEFSFRGPDRADPPIGRFVVTARALPTGEFRVSPGRWLAQARGYPSLALTVSRSPDGQRLAGSFDNRRCGAIELGYSRAVDRIQPPAPPGSAPKGATRGRIDLRAPGQQDCEALPTPAARGDCADMTRYAPRIGFNPKQPGRFANPELIKACEFAYQAIDPIKAPECYSGLAALGRWKTNATIFSQEHPTCEAFAGTFRRLIEHNFPLQVGNWRRYPALDCPNVDRILLARGLDSGATCVRNGADRAKELASCTAHAQGTPAFREAWLEALSQCRTGQPMPLYAAIKARRAERKISDLFEFNCADVVEVVARNDLVSADQLAAARIEIATVEATRPPRESDIIASLKTELSSRFRCFDNRDRKTPEAFFRCTHTGSINPEERKHMDWLDDYLKGTMGGTDRNVTPRLSLNEVVLHGCEKVMDGFRCRYDVGIGCRANATFERPELDILGRMAEPTWCYLLAGPRSRTGQFRRSSNGFEIVRGR